MGNKVNYILAIAFINLLHTPRDQGNSVNQAVFPSQWKKANVIPVHKKTKDIL